MILPSKFSYKVISACAIGALLLFSAQPLAAQVALLRQARSQSMVNIGGIQYYVHTVKKGETLYSLSRLYGVTQGDIVKDNPQAADGIREEQVLKIPVLDQPKQLTQKQLSRKFEQHTVRRGETAYSISKLYGLSVPVLIEDNPGADPTQLSVGQVLNIRKTGLGDLDDKQISRQWDEYAAKLTSVSDGDIFHVVQPGETIYSISRKYDVTQYEVMHANGIDATSIKAGSMLRIPAKAQAPEPVKPTVEQPAAQTHRDGFFDDIFSPAPARNEPKPFDGGVMKVALMLPLQNSAAGVNFLDFYQGALMAAAELKAQGISLEIDLYDTQRSESAASSIVSAPGFAPDLIIGPVYEDVMAPVADFARRNRVPVVSPLAQLESDQGGMVFQLSPDPAAKYDKIKPLLATHKNVLVISGAANDAEFEQEIAPLLPAGARRLVFPRDAAVLEESLRSDRECVAVVLAKDEYAVDNILARISSARSSLVTRGQQAAPVTVVGNSRWQRFVNIDRTLFFKLNLCYVTSYHADRSDQRVMDFNKRYAADFGSLPSLYSYRGYDAMKLFVGTYGREGHTSSLERALNYSTVQLLQVKYNFEQANRNAAHVNTVWPLVQYGGDYTIEVK